MRWQRASWSFMGGDGSGGGRVRHLESCSARLHQDSGLERIRHKTKMTNRAKDPPRCCKLDLGARQAKTAHGKRPPPPSQKEENGKNQQAGTTSSFTRSPSDVCRYHPPGPPSNTV